MKSMSEIMLSYTESTDELQILKHENKLIYRTYCLILSLGAILNYVYFTYLFPQNKSDTVINSLFFAGISMCFLLVGKYGKNEIIKVHVFNALFSLGFTFFVIRYYSHIGPAIWTVSFLITMMSIIRFHRSMLEVVGVTVLLLGFYNWYRSEPFEINITYYIAQLVSFGLVFFISIFIHNINKQSKVKILEQLKIIKSSKIFIEEVNVALEEEIQEHMITQKELSKSEEKFRAIFEGSADPVLIMKNNRIIDCNIATLRMLEYESKLSIIGKKLWEMSPRIQPNGVISQESIYEILEELKSKENMRFEWWHKKSNGIHFVVDIMLTAFILNGERTIHILWRDISERKQLEEELVYLSYHDQLTGLFNRRYFEEELRRLDTRRNLPISLVFADVNNLKYVNDTFGHHIGDELLKNISCILKTECRADDIIARLGGDENYVLYLLRH